MTRVEPFSEHGALRWDTAAVDHDECWPVLRAELASAVRPGTAVSADVSRGLELQIVLDAIERGRARTDCGSQCRLTSAVSVPLPE